MGRESNLWRIRTAGAPFHVRGRMLALELDPVPPDEQRTEGDGTVISYSYQRGAQLELFGENGDGLTLHFTPDREGRMVNVDVSTSYAGHSEGGPVESYVRETGVWIPFELFVEARRIRVRTGAREIRRDVPLGRGTQIMITCTGGRFEFRDLELGE